MADVPLRDAGLGSGITNVSQQVAGALGLAVLGTVATNRTQALAAGGHSAADSLLGGYHLAFAIGAASIALAMLTALVVLPREPRAAAAVDDDLPVLSLLELELELELEAEAELEPQAA
jgi:hypothetical protein